MSALACSQTSLDCISAPVIGGGTKAGITLILPKLGGIWAILGSGPCVLIWVWFGRGGGRVVIHSDTLREDSS